MAAAAAAAAAAVAAAAALCLCYLVLSRSYGGTTRRAGSMPRRPACFTQGLPSPARCLPAGVTCGSRSPRAISDVGPCFRGRLQKQVILN